MMYEDAGSSGNREEGVLYSSEKADSTKNLEKYKGK